MVDIWKNSPIVLGTWIMGCFNRICKTGSKEYFHKCCQCVRCGCWAKTSQQPFVSAGDERVGYWFAGQVSQLKRTGAGLCDVRPNCVAARKKNNTLTIYVCRLYWVRSTWISIDYSFAAVLKPVFVLFFWRNPHLSKDGKRWTTPPRKRKWIIRFIGWGERWWFDWLRLATVHHKASPLRRVWCCNNGSITEALCLWTYCFWRCTCARLFMITWRQNWRPPTQLFSLALVDCYERRFQKLMGIECHLGPHSGGLN